MWKTAEVTSAVVNADNDIEKLVEERLRIKEHDQRMKTFCHAAVSIPSKSKVEEMLKEGNTEIWFQSIINKSGQPATVAWMRCSKKQVTDSSNCLCSTHSKADKKTIFDELSSQSRLRLAALDDEYFTSAKKNVKDTGSSASSSTNIPNDSSIIIVNIKKNDGLTDMLTRIAEDVSRNLSNGEGVKPSELISKKAADAVDTADAVDAADAAKQQSDDSSDNEQEIELTVIETSEEVPRTFYVNDHTKEVFKQIDDEESIGTLVKVNHASKIEYEGDNCIVASEYVDKKEKYVRCMVSNELFSADADNVLFKVGVLKPKKNSPDQFIIKKTVN